MICPLRNDNQAVAQPIRLRILHFTTHINCYLRRLTLTLRSLIDKKMCKICIAYYKILIIGVETDPQRID